MGNHSTVVEFLEQKNIYCTYHKYYKEKQGEETRATLYMYLHQNKPYHIDYCFTSVDFIENSENLEVVKFDKWGAFSDAHESNSTYRF